MGTCPSPVWGLFTFLMKEVIFTSSYCTYVQFFSSARFSLGRVRALGRNGCIFDRRTSHLSFSLHPCNQYECSIFISEVYNSWAHGSLTCTVWQPKKHYRTKLSLIQGHYLVQGESRENGLLRLFDTGVTQPGAAVEGGAAVPAHMMVTHWTLAGENWEPTQWLQASATGPRTVFPAATLGPLPLHIQQLRLQLPDTQQQ